MEGMDVCRRADYVRTFSGHAFSLRLGGKEDLTHDPLGRRYLPTSLSNTILFELHRLTTAVTSLNLPGGCGWGIHECRSYGSFHPWVYSTFSIPAGKGKEMSLYGVHLMFKVWC